MACTGERHTKRLCLSENGNGVNRDRSRNAAFVNPKHPQKVLTIAAACRQPKANDIRSVINLHDWRLRHPLWPVTCELASRNFRLQHTRQPTKLTYIVQRPS